METVTRMVEVMETRLVEVEVEVPVLQGKRSGEPVGLEAVTIDRPAPPPRPADGATDRR